MLRRGNLVPHFEVETVAGALVAYSTIWQRRNLVLVALPTESGSRGRYITELMTRQPEFFAKGAECVVTREPIPGIPAPAVVVADRWGEIAHIVTRPQVDDLTSVDELLDWLDYLEKRCPECEGEAR